MTGQGMRIADEQAALRRVATLVARGAPPEDVLTEVTAEAGRLLEVGHINLVRYETDGTATTVGAWASPGGSAPFPVGAPLRLGGRDVTTQVFETGRPARIDDYDTASGMIGDAVRGEGGGRSAVGVPITVEGRLWGCIVTSTTGDEQLPADAEERLSAFTELAALALANAQARMELRGFAAEQAALRRVATLVARGVAPAETFGAVAAEVGALFAADVAVILRYEPDRTGAVVGHWSVPGVEFPDRGRLRIVGAGPAARVLDTGRAVRLEVLDGPEGSVARAFAELGARSAVGAPITVEGELWGAVLAASTRPEGLPTGSEDRVAGFAELTATAIANAQARTELRGTAAEQAALRNVATLVASGARSEDVFAAVAAEIGKLLAVDLTSVSRYDPGDVVTILGAWSRAGTALPFSVGTRTALGGTNMATLVHRGGRPARLDDYGGATGTAAEVGRAFLVRGVVGAPITVEGRLWGFLAAVSTEEEPLPATTEARLAGFAELVATAIANAQARTELRGFAEEQAALRSVATMVAGTALPDEVFAAVAEEIGRLLDADLTTVARYDPGGVVTVLGAWTSKGTVLPPTVGTQTTIGGTNLATLIFRTRRPGRMDYRMATGAAADLGRRFGFRISVGAPITVAGRLWGVTSVVSTREDTLPAETESRLAGFAELIATAIAGAQARAEVRGAAEEQAALRKAATLVARGASPEEVFAAVTAEVGRLLDADLTHMARSDPDGLVTVVGAWAATDGVVPNPIGSRMQVGGRNVVTQVLRTGRPVRIDDYADDAGPAPAAPLAAGMRAAVGVPITVERRLWGVMILSFTRAEPPAPGIESRLAGFTELIGTAIANAQARVEVRGFAEEQAALRRVATLVARGVAPEEVFAAVTTEVGRVLGCDYTVLSRYDSDDMATVVGAWATAGIDVPVPAGQRLTLGARNLHTLVARSHRPVRLDSYGADAGAAPAAALALGMHSAVGAPIDVAGRLWGVTIAASRGAPLPADTEARLAGFTELVATAVANAEAQAQLAASRARILATADATRRSIERELHDGVQQHLVSLALELRVAQEALLPEAPAAAGRLDPVAEGLTSLLDELREVTRGIHPAALAQGGLRPALRALARRSLVPVRLEFSGDGRLPDAVELAAYDTIAEALTNTAKHASATVVDIGVATADGVLRLEVRDDGRGGATVRPGSGLLGLTDRIEALDGRLLLDSPLGAGTTLQVVLPLDRNSAGPAEPSR